MIIRPQSLQSFKHYNHFTQNNQDIRKKIQNFTFLPSHKIGRGYSSTVYKGQNQTTKQPVAIKVIELKSLRDQNTKRFLTNQLECLRRLDHPNVLRYINSFMTTNNCYIITELYNGGDLSKLLKQKGRFSEEQVFNFFQQFFSGYEHFSQNGYIHRDIKPSNILIRNKNDQNGFQNKNKSSHFSNNSDFQREYVIADFGFIKYHTENSKDSFNVGTPVYMAPQSITSNIYTIKSDIWSMGVMLYELTYGQLPFSSRLQSELKREICHKELKLQDIETSKGVFTSAEFKSFLLSCLRKNPQNRIALNQIAQHQWFKKYFPLNSYTKINITYETSFSQPPMTPIYDLNLRISHPNNYRGSQISRQSLTNQSLNQQKYGYIGNVAVKRQKSLQGNQFGLKKYNNKSSINKQHNSNISIEKQRLKAKELLGFVGQIIDQKDYLSNSKNKQQYLKQNIEILKLKINNQKPLINYSPKIDSLLEKKKSLQQPKQYLLEGMKGVVNLKNDQISKINSYVLKLNRNSSNNEPNRKPTSQKMQKLPNKTDFMNSESTQLSLNKFDSDDNLRENQKYKPRSPFINGFNNFMSENQPQLKKGSSQFIKNKNIENDPSVANQLYYGTIKLQSCPQLPSDASTDLTENKCGVDNCQQSSQVNNCQQLCLKILHLLRYNYEVLILIFEYRGQQVQKFIEARQLLENFFIKLFVKLKKAILSKENLFNLKKWSRFVESKKYEHFVYVINKYNVKYADTKIIGERLKQYSQICDQLNLPSSQIIQSLKFGLLKLAENLSMTNKQTPKKSLRPSSSFNQLIVTIYNVHKCLQMISEYMEGSQLAEVFQKINPQQDLEDMTLKIKDPFRIPKMIIQLKKKLILIESGTFMEQSKINISDQKVGRPKRFSSVKKIDKI